MPKRFNHLLPDAFQDPSIPNHYYVIHALCYGNVSEDVSIKKLLKDNFTPSIYSGIKYEGHLKNIEYPFGWEHATIPKTIDYSVIIDKII
jgi:hypothetical protein